MRLKGWFLIAVAFLFTAVVPCSQAQEKVKFVTSWVLYGADAFLFVAREKGFYQKAGIAIEINRGRGSGNTIKEVGLKQFDFGFADAGALVAGRAAGTRVKEIAMMYGKAPHGVFTLKGLGIQKPKDLEGRTLASTKGSGTDRTFPAFAALAGFDAARVKFQFMEPPSSLPSLLTGKVEGMLIYLTELPIMQAKSREMNKEGELILWADYGFNVYSNGVVAHEDTLANKPEFARRFLRATIEGWAYGMDHPEEAAGLFTKFIPEHSEPLVLAQWKVAASLSASPEAKKNGIGWMLQEKMRATRDIMVKALEVKGEVKVEDLYTNQFNPKVFPKSWK